MADRSHIEDVVRQMLASPQGLLGRQFFPLLGAGRNDTGRVPACLLQHTTDATATTATFYILGTDAPFTAVFETTAHNAGNMRATGFPGRIYIADPGGYDVKWGTEWSTNGTGIRQTELYKNGAKVLPEGTSSQVALTGASTMVRGGCDLKLAADDYLEIRIFQNSGGNLDMLNAHFSATLSANL